MAYFATFYNIDRDGVPVEAIGDRGTIRLDGRESRAHHHHVAAVCATSRGYDAYRIYNGSILFPNYLTDVTKVS